MARPSLKFFNGLTSEFKENFGSCPSPQVPIWSLVIVAILANSAAPARYCWVVPEPQLYDVVADAEQVVLATLVDFQKGQNKDDPGVTTFEIIEVTKGRANVELGQVITVPLDWSALGSLTLLTNKGSLISEWDVNGISSREAFRFLNRTPPQSDTHARMKYFARHLCDSDDTIQTESSEALIDASFDEIELVAEHLPFDKIRRALFADSTKSSRVRLYAMLLGLSGEPLDAELLRKVIGDGPRDPKKTTVALDGILSGYLMLSGTRGLEVLEQEILKNKDASFPDIYAGIMSLRFMWQNGRGRIATERLCEAGRLILDRPEIADVVVPDLVRWGDWSIHERLMEIFALPDEEFNWMKVCAAKYMIASLDVPPEVYPDRPRRVQLGEKYLRQIAMQAPAQAKRALAFERAPFAHLTVLVNEQASDTDKRIKMLKDRGALVFEKEGCVVEISANRAMISDDTLKLIGEFTTLTDLSLEQVSITDKGIAHLAGLQELEWLNLYRSGIGDEGLKHLKNLKSLELLPIGETNVTGKGLVHLKDMIQLRYLGLRGNEVHDKDLAHLAKLTKLTELYLGETKITSAGILHLKEMQKLNSLWLNATKVGDRAIPALANLKSLRTLTIYDAHFSDDGIDQLRKQLPGCRVVDQRPE